MHPDKYSFTWHSYSHHLRDMMKKMMNDDFSDVTLICEDRKHIRAHKNILSASSSVFKDIMKLEQCAKPIIYMKGINFSELDSIIQFIYLGETTFYEERINDLLDVARSLEIKELCNAKVETSDDNQSQPSLHDSETFTDYSGGQTMRSSPLISQTPTSSQDRREVVRVNDKYECGQCDKMYTS